jgi:hypothetical protein
MASEKISQMTPASAIHNVDITPVVQGTANLSYTRPVYLTAQAGEAMYLQGSSSDIGIDGGSNIAATIGSGKHMVVVCSGSNVFKSSDGTETLISAPGGELVSMYGDGGTYLQIAGAGYVTGPYATFQLAAGATFNLTQGTNQILNVTAAGSVAIAAPSGQGVGIAAGSQSIGITSTGIFLVSCDTIIQASMQAFHVGGTTLGTTVTAGPGAGAGASVSISGSDTEGEITITTAGTPTASAIVATVTFHNAYVTRAIAIIGPENQSAAGLGARMPYVVQGLASFTLNSTVSALLTGTTYKFSYHVLGK